MQELEFLLDQYPDDVNAEVLFGPMRLPAWAVCGSTQRLLERVRSSRGQLRRGGTLVPSAQHRTGERVERGTPLYESVATGGGFYAGGPGTAGRYFSNTLNSVRRLRWCSSSVHFVHSQDSLGLLAAVALAQHPVLGNAPLLTR